MWVETNKNDWNDGLTMQTTYYPDTQLQLDWEGSGVGVSSPTAGVPWLEGWKYRRAININNSLSYGLSDYQVWLPTSAFGTNWTLIRSSAQADMDDFRFTPSTATTTIPYWIDPDTNTPKGLWVRVSTLTAGANTIYMYYGNPSASAGQSGDNTFIFFDDFGSGLGKWTTGGVGYTIETVVNPTRLRIYHPALGAGFGGVNSINTFSKASVGDFVLTFNDVKYTINNEADNFRIGLADSSYGPTDNVDGRCAYKRYEVSVNAFTTHAGGSPQDTNLSLTWGSTSHDVDFIFKGTAASMISDGITQANHTTVADAPLEIYVSNEGTPGIEEIFVNDIWIRKYVAPEPGISSVGSEEGPYFSTGTYKSNVLDSGAKVVVSSIGWTPASQPGGSSVNVGLRVSSASFSAGSATPDWVSVTNGQTVNLAGRYVQYMSTFTTTSSTTTPRIEDITIAYKVKPWQEKTVTRTGPNAFGFGGGENWEWEVLCKGGQLVTIIAYVKYNTSYGSASKPKITLYNLGISNSTQMVGGADTWEQLTVSGTPNRNGVLKLKIEGFSTQPGAKMFVDDIQISQ
ncbi:MAG: DUF2341 domain-containing protein [Elusimicrobiota bacterium]